MKEKKPSKFQEFAEGKAIDREAIKAEDKLAEVQKKLTDLYTQEAARLIAVNFEYEVQKDDLPLLVGLMKSLVQSGFDPAMTDKIFEEAINMLNSLKLKDSTENKSTAFCGAVLRIVES
jgi:hypothetical protein